MALSVSIIVPVYNVEKYVADCFQSIINQSYSGPMECMFIDDCGTDNSVQILEGLIKAYDGPIEMQLLHHEKNRGLSAARNTGITHSKADYLFFLDSDDKLFPYSISCLADAALKEKLPDIILGGYNTSVPNHVFNHYCYEYEVLKGQPNIAIAFLNDKLCCMATNKLVNRDFIIKNSLFFREGIIHEDYLWSFQSFHLAIQVITIPEISYFYYIREGSIMQSSSYERSLESTIKIYDEIRRDISSKRYEIVDFKSMNHISKMINAKCVDALLWFYYQKNNRKERLQRLHEMPNEIKRTIIQYWTPSGVYSKIIKSLYKFGFYRIFDSVVMCYMFIQKEL
jgi:glycosyltransferase involved in cell wall biosynthesis